jgi:hypothetical protein
MTITAPTNFFLNADYTYNIEIQLKPKSIFVHMYIHPPPPKKKSELP